MLVLSRKRGEAIRIGGEIVLTVIDIRQGRVRIGIDAPQRHRILRQELEIPLLCEERESPYQMVEAEKASAVSRRLSRRAAVGSC